MFATTHPPIAETNKRDSLLATVNSNAKGDLLSWTTALQNRSQWSSPGQNACSEWCCRAWCRFALFDAFLIKHLLPINALIWYIILTHHSFCSFSACNQESSFRIPPQTQFGTHSMQENPISRWYSISIERSNSPHWKSH